MNEKSTSSFGLLWEQLKRMLSFLTKDFRTGERNSGRKIALLLFICVLVYLTNSGLFRNQYDNMFRACKYDGVAGFMMDGSFALWALLLGTIFGTAAACFLLYSENETLSASGDVRPWKTVLVRFISVFLFSCIGVWNILHFNWPILRYSVKTVCYKYNQVFCFSLLAAVLSCFFGFLLSRIMRRIRHKALFTGIYLVLSEAALWLLAKNAFSIFRDIPQQEHPQVTVPEFGTVYWWYYFLGSAVEKGPYRRPDYLAVLSAAAVLLLILAFSALCLRQRKLNAQAKYTE